MKTLSSILLMCAIVRDVGLSAETNIQPTVVTPVFINQLAEELRTNHPALMAARARTNAAAASAAAIRTWEDPVARLGAMAAREDMRAEEGDLIYGVEQKLPLFGKPGLARRLANAELGTEAANAEYQFQTLRRDLAKAAFRLALENELIAIGDQDLSWLQTMAQSVDARYRTGQATLVDVLQLENERAKRATQLSNDRKRIAHEEVTLNRFLNRELTSPWPAFRLPSLAEPVVFNERLMQFALRYEPKIKMFRQQIHQAQVAVEVSRRQRYPDVNVGFEARNYTGDGSFRQGMMLFSMNLPWVNAAKYKNEVKRDESRLSAVEFDLADYEWSLREEIHGLTVKIEAAHDEALLYGDEIIPRSQSAMESARFGWEANRNSFRDLLDARRMLLEGRSMHARAVAEQYQMLSELVLCCGIGDLEALQMLNEGDSPQPEKKSP